MAFEVDPWLMAEVRWKDPLSRGRPACKAELTPAALGCMMLLILLPFFSFLVIIIASWILIRLDRFTRMTISPLLDRELPSRKGSDDAIRDMLIVSISEARRLAMEAYQARRSSYHDFILVAFGMVGLLGGMVIFVLMISFDVLAGTCYQFPASFIISFSLGAVAFLVLGPSLKPKLLAAKERVVRLDQALAREAVGSPGTDGQTAIELLLQVSSELPEWLVARNKGGYRNPWAWFLIFFVSMFSVSALLSGVPLLFNEETLLSALALIGFGLGSTLIMELIYRNLKKQERAENFAVKEDWERRRRYLEQRYSQLIEEP